MLTRSERLTTRQFDAAFGSSRSVRDGLLSLRVHWRPNNARADLRAAFVVPKKLGCATWRNRTRRRMQEAFRLQRHDLQVLAAEAGACDCIFMAQAGAHDAEFEALQSSVRSLLKRAIGDRQKQRRAGSGFSASVATRAGESASGAAS